MPGPIMAPMSATVTSTTAPLSDGLGHADVHGGAGWTRVPPRTAAMPMADSRPRMTAAELITRASGTRGRAIMIRGFPELPPCAAGIHLHRSHRARSVRLTHPRLGETPKTGDDQYEHSR